MAAKDLDPPIPADRLMALLRDAHPEHAPVFANEGPDCVRVEVQGMHHATLAAVIKRARA